MAKYSTGSTGGSGDGDACELCGRETGDLRRANVAGAKLFVCSNCRPHDDTPKRGGDRRPRQSQETEETEEPSRKKQVAQQQAKVYDAGKGDPDHWVEHGTDYEDDRLPYLVSGYDSKAERARQEEGLTVEELSEELGVDTEDVLAVEQGRAARAGVGGSVVRALEELLDVELVDE